MTTAIELKQKGNEAYVAGRFEAALQFYEEGIVLDGANVDLLNNAAAANFSLGRYDAAMLCARRSLDVRDNFKAHKRLGETLWKMGDLRGATAEYERALALQPGDSSTQRSLQQLNLEMGRGQPRFSSSAVLMPQLTPYGMLGMIVDGFVAVLSCVVLILVFTGTQGGRAWPMLLVTAAARHALMAHSQQMVVPTLSVLKTWFDVRCTLDFVLLVMALISGVREQLPLIAVQGLYSVLSIASNFSVLQRIAPAAYRMGLRYAELVTSRAAQIVIYAASLEAIMLLTVVFSGGAIFTLCYLQYAKNLYRVDGNVRLAFREVRENLTRLARKPFMPTFVDSVLQKSCDTLYQFSQQPF